MSERGVPHELREMRFDSRSLLQAHEVHEHRHVDCAVNERRYAERRRVVGRVGLEPTTNGLRVHCSTN